MCCVPTINVTGVTVNTTTNVATLALDAPLPDRGAFRLRFCNCSGAQLDPFCVTPSGGTATTYSTVYNCPCCCGAIPSFVYLSQVVKQAARCCGILNGKSSFASSGAVFLTDCLPCANVSYATTTTPSA